jgi:hypothetical protein
MFGSGLETGFGHTCERGQLVLNGGDCRPMLSERGATRNFLRRCLKNVFWMCRLLSLGTTQLALSNKILNWLLGRLSQKQKGANAPCVLHALRHVQALGHATEKGIQLLKKHLRFVGFPLIAQC